MVDLIAGLAAVAFGLYAACGFLALWILSPGADPVVAEAPELQRYRALIGPYLQAGRGVGVAAALCLYAGAAVALTLRDGAALSLASLGLIVETTAFLTWAGRRNFVNCLTPGERASEIAGLAGLTSCVALLGFLRFSGVLS